MNRRSGGCCSGCLWIFVVLLLASAWLNSTWPLRAVELLIGVVLIGCAGMVQARRARKGG